MCKYPQSPPSMDAHGRRVLILAFGATSCMVMGVSSIMPMVPAMAKIFDVSLPAASLVITVFTLPGILFALFAGLLADKFGRKAVLLPSLLLFSLAGAACAFAPNFETLLALRFIQGMGAAPLGVLNATIIADTWSGPKMASMIGYNTTALNMCTAIYPSLGGALAYFDWRYPFLLPLFALPVVLVGARTKLSNPGHAETFGNYVSAVGRIFHTRRIVGLLAITGVSFLLLYGPMITCFPVLADGWFGASPALIGGVMALSSLGSAGAASQLGALYSRFSSRDLLMASMVLYLLAIGLLSVASSLAWTLLPILLFGVGQGLNMPNVQTQLLLAASATQRASVMSVNGMLLRLGQTLAPVGFSSIMAGFGIVAGLYVGGALAVTLGCLAFAFAPRQRNV